ncbi:MAG: hypothetical protein JWO71_4269 [Candidatus Acidoferrum typicum]|nr:hypothetical protein [Candidatus Acidoferrum typicum]
MENLSQLILWCSIVLELALLVAGLCNRLVGRFPFFFGYIAFVFLQDLVFVFALHWSRQVYTVVYWVAEFSGLALGSLVVLETYKVSLAAYPGAARMARNALAFVFVTALARGLAQAMVSPAGWKTDTTALEIERALRTVQAAAILALVALFLLYSIPFGRNLRGILLGYGFFIGERVICLAFVSQRTRDFWFYAYSASYLVALSLWLGHLWSYQPIPQPKASLDLEYQRVAAGTRRRLQETRAYLRKGVRW